MVPSEQPITISEPYAVSSLDIQQIALTGDVVAKRCLIALDSKFLPILKMYTTLSDWPTATSYGSFAKLTQVGT